MLSKFFIEHPVLANVLSIILVVLGIVAVFSLPVSQYPNIVPPTVMVTARYPGASPQTIIDTVEMDEDKVLAFFDADNSYLSEWPKEQKLDWIKKWKDK